MGVGVQFQEVDASGAAHGVPGQSCAVNRQPFYESPRDALLESSVLSMSMNVHIESGDRDSKALCKLGLGKVGPKE